MARQNSVEGSNSHRDASTDLLKAPTHHTITMGITF